MEGKGTTARMTHVFSTNLAYQAEQVSHRMTGRSSSFCGNAYDRTQSNIDYAAIHRANLKSL